MMRIYHGVILGLVLLFSLLSKPVLATNWSITMSGDHTMYGSGTFNACETTSNTNISGTYTKPSSGFIHMVNTSCYACLGSNCQGICVPNIGNCSGAATNIYAIEDPGRHLIVQPIISSETQPIYSLIYNACPTTSTLYNFAFAQWSSNNTSLNTQTTVGTFTWNPTSSTAKNTSRYNVTSASSMNSNYTYSNSGCTAGLIPMTGTAGTDGAGSLYINNTGEFFYQTGAGRALFGVTQTTLPNTKILMGKYSGFAFDASGSNTVIPLSNVVVSFPATTIGGTKMLTDTTSDSTTTRTFSLTNLNFPTPGMIRGSFSDGTNQSWMNCVVSFPSSGGGSRTSFFCAGQKPGAIATPYTMLLTSVANFTRVSPVTITNQSGTYGILGVPLGTNQPGSHLGAAGWADQSGNFWSFGGYGCDSSNTCTPGMLNDLWQFDGTNLMWLKGSSTTGGAATYGTKGVAASANTPSARAFAARWRDTSGNMWLFGGCGDLACVTAYNDLWKFDGTNWTWVSGSNTPNGLGVYGSKGTAASSNIPGARAYAATAMDASGNAYLFGGLGCHSTACSAELNDLWKFDGTNWTWISGSNSAGPTTSTFGTTGVANAANSPSGRDGAAMSVDLSGNVYIFGGDGGATSAVVGPLNDTWKFNGTAWAFVAGSSVTSSTGSYGTVGTSSTTSYPYSRHNAAYWTDIAGNFWVFGGTTDIGGINTMSDLWKFDGTNWTWIDGPKTANAAAVGGTQGIPDTANLPGSIFSPAVMNDGLGNVWMFGGSSSGASSLRADIWRLNSW